MVAKALSLLDLLGDYPHGAALSDLATRSGFPLSTTHRLLASLIRGGFAAMSDADRRYHLGLRVFALGQQVATARGFAGTVLPQMEWLSQQTDEAVLMSVLDGDHQLYVHYVQGPQQVGVIGERGRHGPLHCTSMGKVLLAYAPREQSERLVETISLDRLGPNTITDRAEFRAEIAAVRSQGYAIANEEHETGILAIGMPIIDNGGRLRAAISVAAPAFRCDPDRLLSFLPAMRTAAETIRILLAG
jgi:DNA-binding IclR family transcriptional regulator